MDPKRIPQTAAASPLFTVVTVLVVLLGACLASGGCATVRSPEVTEGGVALEEARSRYTIANSDRRVAMWAPEELALAHESLMAAEAAARGRDRSDAEHLAYVAAIRTQIAQQVARERAAQAALRRSAARLDRP